MLLWHSTSYHRSIQELDVFFVHNKDLFTIRNVGLIFFSERVDGNLKKAASEVIIKSLHLEGKNFRWMLYMHTMRIKFCP